MAKRDNELHIGTGLRAAINVAVANTVNVLMRPVETAKTIVGLEKDKTIPEMISDEEARLAGSRSRADIDLTSP